MTSGCFDEAGDGINAHHREALFGQRDGFPSSGASDDKKAALAGQDASEEIFLPRLQSLGQELDPLLDLTGVGVFLDNPPDESFWWTEADRTGKWLEELSRERRQAAPPFVGPREAGDFNQEEAQEAPPPGVQPDEHPGTLDPPHPGDTLIVGERMIPRGDAGELKPVSATAKDKRAAG